jgi:hypothetical protein
MNSFRLLLFLGFVLGVNDAAGAVSVPLTSKLVPDGGAVPGTIPAVDGNYAAESSGSSDYGANTSAGARVLLRDRTLGSAWPVRKAIIAPASLTDVQDFGKSLALDGETLVINSKAHLFIHRRNQGGTDQWGLVKMIVRSDRGLGLDLDGDTLVSQVVTNAGTSIVVYRQNLGGSNAWGVESTVANPRPLLDSCTFCPVERDEAAAWGARVALSGDVFAVSSGMIVAGTREVVIDLFRRGEAGGAAWGLYRTLDRTRVVGAPVQLGTAFDWANGQLCFSALFRSGADAFLAWVQIATPPATADGIWPQVMGRALSGGMEVPLTFAIDVRSGPGWAAVVRLSQSGDTTTRDVTIYRNTVTGWPAERNLTVGPIGPAIDFASLFAPGSGLTDTPETRYRLLHQSRFLRGGLACDGATLLATSLKDPTDLTGPPACATVHERGPSSLWPETAQFTSVAPFAGDFGRAISIGGNMMAVGDPSDNEAQPTSGAVDLWVRDSELTRDWRKFGRVKSDTAQTGANFGRAVATDSQLLIVGAPGENSGRGAVYIYSRGAAVPDTGVYTWRLRAVIRRPTDPADVQFGAAVALHGTEIAIGAPSYPDSRVAGAPQTGRVFLYRPTVAGDFTAWTSSATLLALDSSDNSQFGSTIAWEGDSIAIGAWLQTGGGAAYIFRSSGVPTTWALVKKLVPSDTSRGAFGPVLSLSGTTLAVGTFPPLIFPNAGGAFIFERNSGGVNQWGETRVIVPPANQSGWGAALALDGDSLVIGSNVQSVSGLSRSGTAFVHRRNEGGPNRWGQVRQLIAPDATADDFFGAAVAIDGSAIAISAPGSDAAAPDAGAVYTWRMGSFEIWAGTYAFPIASDTVHSDPDGDGQANLVEFMLGSNPLIRASRGLFAHRITTVGTDQFLEGVWTKPPWATEGVDIEMRGDTDTARFGEYLRSVSDGLTQQVFRAPLPLRVRPRYFIRMEFAYPDTNP